MKYWFTSDTHFGHGNIIRYANRLKFMNKKELELHKKGIPFKVSRESQDRMNNTLIRNWNERVKDNDIVIFAGDFCFKSNANRGEGESKKAEYWINQLKGKKIFIKGNHDKKSNSLKTNILSLLIEIAKIKIYVVHKPEHYNSNYKINFCGHIHDHWLTKRKGKTLLINVGVDVWNYYPVTWNDIVEGLIKREKINLYQFIKEK